MLRVVGWLVLTDTHTHLVASLSLELSLESVWYHIINSILDEATKGYFLSESVFLLSATTNASQLRVCCQALSRAVCERSLLTV